jgi:hypothetical protein
MAFHELLNKPRPFIKTLVRGMLKQEENYHSVTGANIYFLGRYERSGEGIVRIGTLLNLLSTMTP